MSRLALICAVALAWHAAPAAALEAVCLPDSPIVAAGGSVTLRAYTDAAPGTSVLASWSVDRGRIEPTSDPDIVTWRPGVATAKEAAATITARLTAGTASASCTAQVVVLSGPDRGVGDTIIPAAILLPPASSEPPGYGLYSYVLFARRAQTPEERERIDAVLKAVLALSSSVTLEQNGFARSQLNATIVPLGQPLPGDFAQRDDKPTWLRNNYAYERALKLLLKLHGVSEDGAFSPTGTVWVVSCLHPLNGTADPRPVLVQDLSAVPVRLIGIWAARFAAITTQPRLYDRHSLAKLSLDLRIAIAQAGDGVNTLIGAFRLLGLGALD